MTVRGGMWARLLVAFAAVASVAAGGCTDSGPSGGFDDDVAAELDAVVERGVERSVAGGFVVRVVAPSGERTTAVGPAEVDGAAELTGAEAFRIASITKLFTATVALQLAEEGVVDLDAPVAEVVPERAATFEHGGAVTLRQLLGHTAGLPVEPDQAFFDDARELASVEDGVVSASCAEVAELDEFDYTDGDAEFAPGTDWAYSNMGYRLAGEVIEAVTGEPLEDAYRSRILDPLGMEATWLDCAEEPRGELAAGIHPPGVDDLPGADGEALDVTHWPVSRGSWAAGGLVSTAEDLTVFARALFEGDLFDDDATLEAMLEPGPNPGYGLGVGLGGVVGHDGALAGYNTRLSYHPQRDIAVVVLHNASEPPHAQPPSRRMANEVLNAVPRVDGND